MFKNKIWKRFCKPKQLFGYSKGWWVCFANSEFVVHDFFFLSFLIYTLKIVSSVSEKQTSFSCTVKKKKKTPVLCMLFFSSICRLYAWRDLKAFIPTGNQPELFLCQFPPTPQFRWALSPTNPTMKDLSSFSLSTSDIFFLTAPSLQTACSVCK